MHYPQWQYQYLILDTIPSNPPSKLARWSIPLFFISSIIEQSVKLSFLSAYFAKVIHPFSSIYWSIKSIGGVWNTIHRTTKVSEQCDVGRILEG